MLLDILIIKVYSSGMSSENQSRHEQEPPVRSHLRRLFSDLHTANTYQKLMDVVPDYLSKEYEINLPSNAWNLAHDLQDDIMLPTEQEYDVDPDAAKAKITLYTYGTLVPLYEETHTAIQSQQMVAEAVRYATMLNADHTAANCIDSVYDEYERCSLGDCLPRYIVFGIRKRIESLTEWATDEGVDLSGLKEKDVKIKNHIEAAFDNNLITLGEAASLTDHLKWRVELMGGEMNSPFNFD